MHVQCRWNENGLRWGLRGADGGGDGVADAGAEHVDVLAEAAEPDVPPACAHTYTSSFSACNVLFFQAGEACYVMSTYLGRTGRPRCRCSCACR